MVHTYYYAGVKLSLKHADHCCPSDLAEPNSFASLPKDFRVVPISFVCSNAVTDTPGFRAYGGPLLGRIQVTFFWKPLKLRLKLPNKAPEGHREFQNL